MILNFMRKQLDKVAINIVIMFGEKLMVMLNACTDMVRNSDKSKHFFIIINMNKIRIKDI